MIKLSSIPPALASFHWTPTVEAYVYMYGTPRTENSTLPGHLPGYVVLSRPNFAIVVAINFFHNFVFATTNPMNKEVRAVISRPWPVHSLVPDTETKLT
eukprot:scaffold51740_cov54-Attheya_sp.AAC.2